MTNEEIKLNKFWVGAILFNPETRHMLMQKRDEKAPVNPNKWAFFGGTGEVGESLKGCLVRELLEEIGVEFQPESFTPLCDYLNEQLMTWRYCFTAECALDESQITLGEGEAFAWISFDQILNYDLTDNTRKDIEFFLQRFGKI